MGLLFPRRLVRDTGEDSNGPARYRELAAAFLLEGHGDEPPCFSQDVTRPTASVLTDGRDVKGPVPHLPVSWPKQQSRA